MFRHDQCKWIVEFVTPPVAIGEQIITEFQTKSLLLDTIHLLRPEDSVKDRLASFFHWDDREGLEQAISICPNTKLDLDEVKDWAISQAEAAKLTIFLKRLENILK